MPDWSEQVITWDEAREYIEGGTVESLGKLRRSEQQLTTYRAFMDKVGSQRDAEKALLYHQHLWYHCHASGWARE